MNCFLFFAELSYSLRFCVVDKASENNTECNLENSTIIDAQDFVQQIFTNVDSLEVYVCCPNLTVHNTHISGTKQVVFSSSSKKTQLFIYSNETVFFENACFIKITVHFFSSTINFGLLNSAFSAFIGENITINARKIITTIETLSGVTLLNVSKETILNLQFNEYIRPRTILTIDSPVLYLSGLKEDATITFAGQSLRIASSTNKSKVFEFFPCRKKIECTVCNILEAITISVVNLFTSAIFKNFIMKFMVSMPVNFYFMRSSWEGFYLVPIQLNLYNDCNFTIDTDYVPMVINAFDAELIFNIYTEYFRVENCVYLENSILRLVDKCNKRGKCLIEELYLKNKSQMHIREKIDTYIKKLVVATKTFARICGDIYASTILVNAGEASFNNIVFYDENYLRVNYQQGAFRAMYMSVKNERPLTLALSGSQHCNEVINEKLLISAFDSEEDYKIETRFDSPNYICDDITYCTSTKIKRENGTYQIYVTSEKDRRLNIINQSCCLIESNQYANQCPNESTVIDFEDFNESSFNFMTRISIVSASLEIYVFGTIPCPIEGLSQSYTSISLNGDLPNTSFINLSDASWHSLTLINITVCFIAEAAKTFNNIVNRDSVIEGVDELNINNMFVYLSKLPSLKSCNIKNLIIFSYDTQVDIVSRNDSLLINGIWIPDVPCKFMIEDNSIINLKINGSAIEMLDFQASSYVRINIEFNYQINKLVLPTKSDVEFTNNNNLPKNLLVYGCLFIKSEDPLIFDSLILYNDGMIRGPRVIDIFVKRVEFHLITTSPLREKIRVHSDYVLIANSSGIETTIYDAKMYVIEPMSIITIKVPNEDRIKDINFTIKYQMGSVPSITFHGTREVESVHLDMYNTGSSYQLLTDQGWNDVEVGVISIDNISNNSKIDTYFRSMSWAFQQETRVFDLILTKTRDYKNKPIYSIVKMNKTIPEEADKETNDSNKLLIGVLSASLLTIAILVIVFIVRKKHMDKRVKQFASECVSHDSLIEHI